jgi:hypothetical protein
MSKHLDFEAIAQEIEKHAIKAGRALADYLTQHFADGLDEIDFEQHRIADYIFHRTATDVLARFHMLSSDDEVALQDRATAIVRSAFEARRAELNGGET